MGYEEALPVVIESALPGMNGDTVKLRYELTDCIGRGGMASVYRARDLDPPGWYRDEHGDEPRIVAIKFPHDEIMGETPTVIRFRQEAELLHSIEHRNVVRVINLGQDQNGRAFYVMEFIENAKSIASEIFSRKFHGSDRQIEGSLVPVELVTDLLRQALEALCATHAVGVVHRDIKPDNFLLQRTAQGRRVILTDFGISKDTTKADLTAVGNVVGTPPYMAPEQTRQYIIHPVTEKPWGVGPWTDIWSLGVVAYELVTGELPFTADVDKPGLIMAKVATDGIPYTPLEEYVQLPDPALKEFIEVCLVKAPWERPGDARELSRLLGKSKTALTLSVPPPHVVDKSETETPLKLPKQSSVAGVEKLLNGGDDAAPIFLETEPGVVAPRDSKSLWTVFALLGVLAVAGLFFFAWSIVHEENGSVASPSAHRTARSAPTYSATSAEPSVTPPSAPSALREPGSGPARGSKLRDAYDKGLAAFQAGNCRHASMDMNIVLMGHPSFPPPLRILGECARRAGKLEEARDYFRKYLGYQGVDPLPPEAQAILK